MFGWWIQEVSEITFEVLSLSEWENSFAIYRSVLGFPNNTSNARIFRSRRAKAKLISFLSCVLEYRK